MKYNTIRGYLGGGYVSPMGYQSGGYIPGVSQAKYGIGLQRDITQAQKEFEEHARKVEKEQKKNKPQNKPIQRTDDDKFIRECEAFIKKTSDPDKLKVLKTNISKRYKDEKITGKDRDNLLSLILQKDD